MFSYDNIESKINRNEYQIRKLSAQLENLKAEEEQLLEELNVTPEQLTEFISMKENFSEENWNELQKKREELDKNLLRSIENIRNPKLASAAFADRMIHKSWLYVK